MKADTLEVELHDCALSRCDVWPDEHNPFRINVATCEPLGHYLAHKVVAQHAESLGLDPVHCWGALTEYFTSLLATS